MAIDHYVDFLALCTLAEEERRLLDRLDRLRAARAEAYRYLARPAPNVPLACASLGRIAASHRDTLAELDRLADRAARLLGRPVAREPECEPCPPSPN